MKTGKTQALESIKKLLDPEGTKEEPPIKIQFSDMPPDEKNDNRVTIVFTDFRGKESI